MTFKSGKVDNPATRVNLLPLFATLIPNAWPHVLHKGPGKGVIYLQISEMLAYYTLSYIFTHVDLSSWSTIYIH